MDKPRDESVKRKKKFRRLAVIAATVAGFSVLTAWIFGLEPAAPGVDRESVYLGTVERGDMLREVRGPGKLVPKTIEWIAAETAGRVERIVELPGVEVTPETIVLELSNPELEQSAQDAILELREAEATAKDLEVRLQSDLLNRQAEAARVRAEYEEAVLDVTAHEELAREGLIPDIDLRKSRLREQQLAQRDEIEVKRLEKLDASVAAQIASEDVRLERLRAVRDLRRNQMAALVVRAGIRGVLQEVPVEVGQRVSAGTNLARVVQPDQLKAELQIPQVQAKDLLLGQLARIDTRNGIVEGQVARIDPAVREGTVTIDVELGGELPRGARPDLSVDGTIEIERLENVLYMGRPTYGQAGGRIELFKLVDDSSAVRVPVQLGRSSVSTFEIVEGLAEGDRVILSDIAAFDGADRLNLR